MLKALSRFFARPGAAAGTVGAAVALQLLVARALASATDTSVNVAGHELHWECAFRTAFGIPCPNCGMTRSVLMTLHGDLGRAARMNPAGPVLVAGLLLFVAAMFFLMFYQRARPAPAADGARRRILIWMSAYGCLFVAVQMGHWLWVIA